MTQAWKQVAGSCAVIVSWAIAPAAGAYDGSSYRAVRDAVFRDPYAALPAYSVSRDSFGAAGDHGDNHLRQAARRTLTVRDDLYDFPHGRKLIQPNGICFGGHWQITGESPYTGLLAPGARAPAVARASVALGDTESGHRRAFAVAVKLFPTEDPDAVVPTANLLLKETIAGTLHPHFLDAVLDNHPDLGGLPSWSRLGLALRIRGDLNAVDRELSPGGPDLRYRPVDELAEAGLVAGQAAHAPRWLRLQIKEGTPRVDAPDFRDELQVANYPGSLLVWDIDVAASNPRGKDHADWHRIGSLTLHESVVSRTCDGRLHFAHPILKAAGAPAEH